MLLILFPDVSRYADLASPGLHAGMPYDLYTLQKSDD